MFQEQILNKIGEIEFWNIKMIIRNFLCICNVNISIITYNFWIIVFWIKNTVSFLCWNLFNILIYDFTYTWKLTWSEAEEKINTYSATLNSNPVQACHIGRFRLLLPPPFPQKRHFFLVINVHIKNWILKELPAPFFWGGGLFKKHKINLIRK